jgi:hypothetical protein
MKQMAICQKISPGKDIGVTDPTISRADLKAT